MVENVREDKALKMSKKHDITRDTALYVFLCGIPLDIYIYLLIIVNVSFWNYRPMRRHSAYRLT